MKSNGRNWAEWRFRLHSHFQRDRSSDDKFIRLTVKQINILKFSKVLFGFLSFFFTRTSNIFREFHFMRFYASRWNIALDQMNHLTKQQTIRMIEYSNYSNKSNDSERERERASESEWEFVIRAAVSKRVLKNTEKSQPNIIKWLK